jgi:signal transduction histidine kinase
MRRNFVSAILEIGSNPKDDEHSRPRKRLLVMLATFMSLGGLLWGVICVVFKMSWVAAIPFGYVFFSILNMIYFGISKNFEVVQTLQIFMSLLLPFLFQIILGGYDSSGGVIYWSFLSVLGSFSLTEIKVTLYWIVSFVLMAIAGAFLQPILSNHIYADLISNDLREVLFVFNLVSVSTVIYMLVRYFVVEQQDAHAKIQLAERSLIQTTKLSALGEMAGGIAHEINNPLAIVMGKVEKIQRVLAKRGIDFGDLESEFEMTLDTIKRISGVVGGLKKLAQDGSSEDNCEINLRQVIEETLVIFREKFKLKT